MYIGGPSTERPLRAFKVAERLYIVYRQVFKVPYMLHFEPSLNALSLRSDVISSINILSQSLSVGVGADRGRLRPPSAECRRLLEGTWEIDQGLVILVRAPNQMRTPPEESCVLSVISALVVLVRAVCVGNLIWCLMSPPARRYLFTCFALGVLCFVFI